jgi:hypothetical protein
MKKPFLLMAGYGEWIACYETEEAAMKEVEIIKGNSGSRDTYKVKNDEYDWYDIIDLRNWTED